MKISVCFKVIPDYDKVPKQDWERPDKLDFEYVKNIFGVFDEGALESALCLKEEMNNAGEECLAEAVTYGQPDDIFVSTLYAVGFDRVVEIHGRNTDFSPEDTAAALADFFNHGGQDSDSEKSDIILLGKMTGPNDSGTVPYFLAKKLGLPVLNQITALRFTDGKTVISRKGKDSLESYCYDEPLVGIMEDAEKPYLRMYTLRTMMENKDKKSEIVEYKGKPGKNNFKIVPVEKRKTGCEFLDLEPSKVWGYLKEEIEKIIGNSYPNHAIAREMPEVFLNKPGNMKRVSGSIEERLENEKDTSEIISDAKLSVDGGGKEDDAAQKDLREIYSGYLRLKKKTSLFSGNEEEKTAEELCGEILSAQKKYMEPASRQEFASAEDNLSDAEIVIALGQGLKNRETFKKFEEEALRLGIPVGCTRLAAMNGHEDYSKVIGISGKSLKAKLCICIGISGAGPFQQGLKDVKKVIAINNDEDALIFDRADIGIVCDAREIFK